MMFLFRLIMNSQSFGRCVYEREPVQFAPLFNFY